jgi:sarcosine oxidase subunit delta
MLRIPCPFCGVRDEAEFRFRGDASVVRPAEGAGLDEFHRYVYERANPLGWHREWWLHVFGCRQLLLIERHTLSHEIRSVSLADGPGPAP